MNSVDDHRDCEFFGDRPESFIRHSGKPGLLGPLPPPQARVPVVIHTIHGPPSESSRVLCQTAIFATPRQRAAKATTHFRHRGGRNEDQYLAAGIDGRNNTHEFSSGFRLEPFLDAKNDLQLRRQLGLAPQDIVVAK